MGGVGKCDQFLSYYAVGRNTMKWWKKVFLRMFELCIINSMCIYFEKYPDFAKRRSSHKLFREILVHQLVQPYLHAKSEKEYQARSPLLAKSKCKIAVDDDFHLRGKH